MVVTRQAKAVGSAAPARARERGQTRIYLLALVFFLLGVCVSIIVLHHAGKRGGENANELQRGLLDGTKSVLQRLSSPVVIRFYALLAPAKASDPVKTFAARVDDLLSAYERAGHGEIQVNRIDTVSDANADAAAADGLRTVNLANGTAACLGLVVTANGQKETLPLSPEWEGAVQFDLTRAIERVSQSRAAAVRPAAKPAISPVAIAEVKRAIPRPEAVSLDQGTEILRENAVREYAAVAAQMEAQVKDAQQRLAQAQKSGSAADQTAAMKNLQQVQVGQADQIKQIAAALQDRIAAWQQLKQP